MRFSSMRFTEVSLDNAKPLQALVQVNDNKHPPNKCIFIFLSAFRCIAFVPYSSLTHKMSYDLISFAYAAIVAIGGIIGFVKKAIVNKSLPIKYFNIG